MKKSMLFLILFASSAFISVQAADVPLTMSNPDPNPIRPRTPILIPVSVDLSETEMYLNFTTSVGVSTITVKDSNGTIVHQETLDTDVNTELYISTADWDLDDYSIEITYGNYLLWGEFTIE